MKRWRFEQVLTVLLLIILAAALAAGIYSKNDKLVEWIVPALITSFAGLISFFQTKHKPDGNKTENEGDKP